MSAGMPFITLTAPCDPSFAELHSMQSVRVQGRCTGAACNPLQPRDLAGSCRASCRLLKEQLLQVAVVEEINSNEFLLLYAQAVLEAMHDFQVIVPCKCAMTLGLGLCHYASVTCAYAKTAVLCRHGGFGGHRMQDKCHVLEKIIVQAEQGARSCGKAACCSCSSCWQTAPERCSVC